MPWHKRLLLAAAVSAVIGSTAYATQNETSANDAERIAHAGISLAQAVLVAEQSANGKASSAECNDTRNGPVYDIEVVSGAQVFDVRVDAAKGSVISSAEDRADQDDDEGA